jgi:hypothetical protein
MKKRVITIVGIALILIAISIISVVRSQVGVPSAEVRGPVAVNVHYDVVGEASLVQREVTGDVQETVETSAVKQVVNLRGVTQTVGVVGRNSVRQKQGVELAAVARAVEMRVRVSQVQDALV